MHQNEAQFPSKIKGVLLFNYGQIVENILNASFAL